MPSGLMPAVRRHSVLAELEELDGFAPERVLDELFVTRRAQVEAQLLVDIRADLIAIGLFELFEDVMDFLHVVALVTLLVDRHRIERRIDLHLDDVAKVLFRIEFPMA
jgi:hypothetical protein